MNRVLIIFEIKILIASLSICGGGFGDSEMGLKNNL